jgi:hypothetical protein
VGIRSRCWVEGGRGSRSTKEIRRPDATEGERSVCAGVRRLLLLGLVLPGRDWDSEGFWGGRDRGRGLPCRCEGRCADEELLLDN